MDNYTVAFHPRFMERDSVSRIEIGTRFVTDYELVILAKVLGVSMEWLTEQEEN